MTEHAKPLPRMDPLHDEFYAHLNNNELRFQRCECGDWRHMPRESCEICGSFNWTWEKSSGKAELFSWTTVYRPLHPAYEDEVPYTVVVVEMEEGTRLCTRLEDIADEDLKIGLPLQVAFEQVTPEVTLHKFVRAKA
jgi:hypothetical protein